MSPRKPFHQASRTTSDRPLRITILGLHYRPESTGNAPYTTALAEGLFKRGYSVRVIAGHPHYPEWKIRDGYGDWATHDIENGVRLERKRHFVPRRPSSLLRLLSEVSFGLRLLFARWGRPDVVVLVSPALFSTAVAALRSRWGIRRPTTAIWVQDLYSLGISETGQGGHAVERIMKAVEAWVLRGADGVAVVHDRFKDYVVGQLGVSEQRVEVIRNWSHLQTAPKGDRYAMRQSLGWAEGDIVVLHAGNMGMKQGLENVVAAARISSELGKRVSFVLMGDGNQRRYLEEIGRDIDRLQIIDSVPDSQFQQMLDCADILLVNERVGVAEMSVPSKLTSYFSTGLPVIGATDVGSITANEIKISGGGVRVDAGAPAQLVDIALALGGDPERAWALGAAGQRFRKEILSAGSAIDHYSNWLSSLSCKR